MVPLKLLLVISIAIFLFLVVVVKRVNWNLFGSYNQLQTPFVRSPVRVMHTHGWLGLQLGRFLILILFSFSKRSGTHHSP